MSIAHSIEIDAPRKQVFALYKDVGSWPVCRMQFGHELDGEGDKTSVTHWVRFTGPLAPLFRRLIGAPWRINHEQP